MLFCVIRTTPADFCPVSRPKIRERSGGPEAFQGAHRTVLMEEREVDRVGHCLVASIVRMEMIFGRETGQKSAGVVRITQNSIEVDYTVKHARASDPLVNRLPGGFLRVRDRKSVV